MYAIFEAKGKQFRAEPDMTLLVPSLDAEPGERVTFDHVLLAERDEQVMVGQPSLEGASVSTEVVRHGRGEKIIVFKMKRRKGYRKKQGHRQGFTEIRIVDIDLGAGRSVKRPAKVETPKAKKAVEAEAPKAGKLPRSRPGRRRSPSRSKSRRRKRRKSSKAEKPAAVDATDTARSLAEENGIDLSTIVGTGKEGRILKSDVANAIKEREGN